MRRSSAVFLRWPKSRYARLGFLPLLAIFAMLAALLVGGIGHTQAASGQAVSPYEGTCDDHCPTTSFSQQQIDAAVAAPLLVFPAPNATTPRPGTGPSRVYGSKAVYFLAEVARYFPHAAASNGASVVSRLVAQVNSLTTGGQEPDANSGLEGWAHNAVAQALLLVRHEGAVWGRLSESTRSKVDLLMEALAIAGNWGFSDANNFHTGLDELCNFSKTDNPNFREGYANVVIAASLYFGPKQLNRLFISFDYTRFTHRLQEAGFTNIINTWAKTGPTLMMQGGTDQCGGAGVGVRAPFVYQNVPLSNPVGIFAQLATFTYSDIVTSTGANGKAFIADHTASPYQGQMGMEHEFNSTDSKGPRSDALYSYEGWMNSITTRATLAILGDWGCGAVQERVMQLESVGTGDLIYKLQHGYQGYELGATRLVTQTQPSSDGPSAKGFFFDQQTWQVVLTQRQSCQD